MSQLRSQGETRGAEVCLIRKTTGIPCPSCGTTQAINYILLGDLREAMLANPLGFIMLLAMAAFPVWIITDLALNKNGFFRFYHYVEYIFRKKVVAIPAILLIIAIWIWNIIKLT